MVHYIQSKYLINTDLIFIEEKVAERTSGLPCCYIDSPICFAEQRWWTLLAMLYLQLSRLVKRALKSLPLNSVGKNYRLTVTVFIS